MLNESLQKNEKNATRILINQKDNTTNESAH